MAHIIAVANQKRGVGKTTTTVNLGACLANLGKKILIVDADAQGNATSGVGVQKAQVEKDIYDVLVNEEPITEAILPTKHKNMSIVPATIQLAGAEIELTVLSCNSNYSGDMRKFSRFGWHSDDRRVVGESRCIQMKAG